MPWNWELSFSCVGKILIAKIREEIEDNAKNSL